MLDLPRSSLDKIKKLLQKRKREVESQIQELDKEDPVLADGVAESTEPGTDSFRADAHGRLQAVKGSLIATSKSIQHSLNKLAHGSYGRCDKCGKRIETARLLAMPTASLCLSCSKKYSR